MKKSMAAMVLAAVPVIVTYAALLGLGMHRHASPWAVSAASTILLFVPPLAVGLPGPLNKRSTPEVQPMAAHFIPLASEADEEGGGQRRGTAYPDQRQAVLQGQMALSVRSSAPAQSEVTMNSDGTMSPAGGEDEEADSDIDVVGVTSGFRKFTSAFAAKIQRTKKPSPAMKAVKAEIEEEPIAETSGSATPLAGPIPSSPLFR